MGGGIFGSIWLCISLWHNWGCFLSVKYCSVFTRGCGCATEITSRSLESADPGLHFGILIVLFGGSMDRFHG